MANKTKKKTEEEIKTVDNFKKYVEQYASKTNYVNTVSFYEQSTKDNFRVVATLDCGSFQQRIVYYAMYFFEESFIDVEFSFENSEYSYMLYDIFNLFDIEDFNLYYYSNAEAEEEIENAVKGVFDATENYLYYLEKAGSDTYLSDLEKNYEADMDSSWSGSDWREDEKDIDDVFFPPMNHPLMSFADGKLNEKAIKKLKKKGEKGKLDTIYEKRLLKHIEAGNTVERKNIAENEEFEKAYLRKTISLSIVAFLILFVITLIVSFSWHAVIFKGADMYGATYQILGLSIKLPLERIEYCAGTAFALTLALGTLFGKKLIMKRMPENMRNRAGSKYDKDTAVNLGKFSKPIKILISALVLIGGIFFFIGSVEDIGFYDTYVRYNSDISFGVTDVRYEDLEIYKVNFVYDEDDELIECENAYAISDGKGNYYDYGELLTGGKAETRLKEIAEKYNKEIVEIETIDTLYSDVLE